MAPVARALRASPLTYPAAQRAQVQMGEFAAGIHPDSTIDDRPEIDGDRVVVDIRQMNIERLGLQVLRVQRRPFELRIGLRRPVTAQYFYLVLAVPPMQYEEKVHQAGVDQLRFVRPEIAASPRKALH